MKLISGACRARAAIVCCFVEMVSGLGMSAIVPLRRSAIRRPLPSTGSRRVSSPASAVVRGAPTPCRPSRRASLPSLGGTALALAGSLLLSDRAPSLTGQGVCYTSHPRSGSRAETTGPRRFLGNPIVRMPCSSTPVGLPRQASTAHQCCLPQFKQRRLPQYACFRGSITRPVHSLSTLRRQRHR